MKVTKTIAIDGKDKAEYEAIKAHLEALQAQFPQWKLIPEPLINRMTAVLTEEVASL